MMTDSVQGEGSHRGGSGEQERLSVPARARAAITRARRNAWEAFEQARAAYRQARKTYAHARVYDYAVAYAHVREYVSLVVKASSLVALLLSTVILLGGYVQSLGSEDFFCIMAITVIQAVGIFQDWENNLQYLNDFGQTFIAFIQKLTLMMNLCSGGIDVIIYIFTLVVVLLCCILLFYFLGPVACAAISDWRMVDLSVGYHRNGTEIDSMTDSMKDMVETLNIFYSLIIFQGTMFLVLLLLMSIYYAIVVRCLDSLEQLSDNWGKDAIRRYISDITGKCRKDPLSTKGMDLIKYAAELLDSGSQEDYLYGARLLSAFIKKRKDISWVLLPSTDRIQRLIDSLWISSGSIDETQRLESSPRRSWQILLDVARYPGAMRYISSLLLQEETTQAYWNSSKQVSGPRPPKLIGPFEALFQSKEQQLKNLTRREEEREWRLIRHQQRLGISQERRRQKGQGGTSNKLVQKGLTILERLPSNSDNRRLICCTAGLLPKITAPLYSATSIKDEELETKAWADIVTRCLKVLYQLIRAPGRPSRRLRRQIFSNHQAVGNLKSILELSNEADHQELKLRAMEILTELALDLSINLSKEIKVLVTKQLKLFLLANGDDEESAAVAGRAMVSLSSNSESNSALIMSAQNDITGRRLTEILDDKNNITRRTIAAQIMANLCAHCNDVDNDMKEILPKVLREIMPIKRMSQEREESGGQNNSASGDEENQGNSVSTNNEERHNISTQGDDTEIEEISDQEREEQEAFLSLAQVICDKLNSADLDGAIQNAVQNENNAGSEEQRREAFVDKLKTIIDGNCHPEPAADSLRIVKLCGQIAKSVMQCEQYVEIFRNKGFKSSLSEASKTMSELESCMLFVGTDFGLRKTVRPLFSEIEKTWSEM